MRVIGRLHEAPADIVRSIREAEDRTRGGEKMALNIAFNYAGRAEIIDAARALVAAGVPAQEIDEDRFGEHLYTAGQPDPDLIIRTGGEQRTSNFLLWQGAYAELVFCRHPVAGLRRGRSGRRDRGVRSTPAPLRRMMGRCSPPA